MLFTRRAMPFFPVTVTRWRPNYIVTINRRQFGEERRSYEDSLEYNSEAIGNYDTVHEGLLYFSGFVSFVERGKTEASAQGHPQLLATLHARIQDDATEAWNAVGPSNRQPKPKFSIPRTSTSLQHLDRHPPLQRHALLSSCLHRQAAITRNLPPNDRPHHKGREKFICRGWRQRRPCPSRCSS